MAQNMSNYDAVLKEYYLPPIIDAFPEFVELYDEFSKDAESWTGNKVIQPVRVLRTSGKGARADGGTLPTAGNQTYQEHQVTAKYNYARIQVTGPVMRASANNTGAFEKAVASEIKYTMRDFLDQIDIQLYLGGTGQLGLIDGAHSGTTTIELEYAGASSGPVSGEPGTRYLHKGMILNIGTAVEHAAGTAESVTISSITDADTFVSTASETLVDQDIVVLADTTALATSSYGYCIEGLDAAFITTGSYQNINVGTYPDWMATVKTNPAGSGTNRTLTEPLMQNCIDSAYKKGGKIDLIVTSVEMRPEVLDLVKGDKRYLTPANMDAGYTGDLLFNGIKIKFCRNCQYNRLYFLDRSTWTLHEQGKINWMDEDGAILSRVSGSDAYEATLRYYANLGCENPAANAVLKDITISSF